MPNVNNFMRDGKRLGAMGALTSHWADDGEALFNMTWYGVVFAAASSWQNGSVEPAAFDRAFDWAFYRNRDETFVSAIRKLYGVHKILRSAGIQGAVDNVFWADPFSRQGSETMRKAFPAASKSGLKPNRQRWISPPPAAGPATTPIRSRSSNSPHAGLTISE